MTKKRRTHSPEFKARDRPVAVAAKPAREIDDFSHERFLVVFHPQLAMLGRPSLLDHTEGSALGDAKFFSHV